MGTDQKEGGGREREREDRKGIHTFSMHMYMYRCTISAVFTTALVNLG